MHVPYVHRPTVLSQKMQPERRARREVYGRSSRRHFMCRKQRPSIQLEVRSDMSARGENPFQADGIYSRPVGGVCPLEHNKRRHRFHRNFESSIEKTRPMRSRQDPSVANSGIPHAGIPGPARNRMAATSPNLELTTALLWAILGRREKRNQQETNHYCNEPSHKCCRH